MDSWETFFREKSSRRAAHRDYRAIARWTCASVGFLVVIVGLMVGLNSL
jgi:hypothetical protein